MNYVTLLSSAHASKEFDCGEPESNRYLRQHAHQNADRHLGITRVVTSEPDSSVIQCYYTLVTRTVTSISLAATGRRRLSAGDIGVVLLGRLAVDSRFQRQELGQRMLLRAMAETAQAAQRVDVHALVLDTLNDKARAWYLRLDFGFQPLLDDPSRLFVPITFIDTLGLGSTTDKL